VVLDHRRDHDVVGRQPEPVGEVVDRLGGVATEDGHVAATGRPAGEAHGRNSRRLVGPGRELRLVTRTPMHARVPGEEVLHGAGHHRQGAGRRRRVQVEVPALVAVDAGRHRTVAD
jgi:hypothetical protein